MNISRQDIYTYITSLLKDITNNIYRIEMPQILVSDAIKNGFIILKLGSLNDFSEIGLNTYTQVRMYIEYYVPAMQSDGTINTSKYKIAQEAIDDIINAECLKKNSIYSINRDDGILSMEDYYTNNTNSFFLYITSILITNTNEI